MKGTGWKRWLRMGLIAAGILVSVMVVTLVLLACWPLHPDELQVTAHPIESYAEAKAEIARLRTLAPDGIREECRGTVLDHGRKTEVVYVLLHGLSNCPAQFRQFGELLFQRGANVLIPRTPYHGLADRLTTRLEDLTAGKLLLMANVTVDLAHGFGDRVIVVGLSVNGATAAWLAQNRPDLERVVLISAFLAPPGVDSMWLAPIGRLLYRLPNKFLWWDPVEKEHLPGPEYSYPRFATHSIAQILRIGLDVFQDAEGKAPAVKDILVITSASDFAVNNARTAELAEVWRKQGAKVTSYEFAADKQVPHDCIDPNQPQQKVGYVYPELLKLF